MSYVKEARAVKCFVRTLKLALVKVAFVMTVGMVKTVMNSIAINWTIALVTENASDQMSANAIRIGLVAHALQVIALSTRAHVRDAQIKRTVVGAMILKSACLQVNQALFIRISPVQSGSITIAERQVVVVNVQVKFSNTTA